MTQGIGEGYSLMDQQFLLDIVLGTQPGEKVDIKAMKEMVKEYSTKVVESDDQSNFDQLRDELKSKVLIVVDKGKKEAPAGSAAADGAAPTEGQVPTEGGKSAEEPKEVPVEEPKDGQNSKEDNKDGKDKKDGDKK
jgi:hypothetical protein